MKLPKHFKGEAREFWKRNSKGMIEDGRLSAHTYDSFLLLCSTWQMYVEGEANGLDAIKIVALGKQLQNQFGQWGMTPASRKKMKLDEKKQNIADVLRAAIGEHGEPTEEGEGEGNEPGTASETTDQPE